MMLLSFLVILLLIIIKTVIPAASDLASGSAPVAFMSNDQLNVAG